MTPQVAAQAEPTGDRDLLLYESINQRVSNGQPYYEVAADEQRKGSYPLRPFVTVRLPTLAKMASILGRTGMLALLAMLAGATLLAWWYRLRAYIDRPVPRLSATLLVGAGVAIVANPQYVVLHEVWAGLLLALAIPLYRSERWLPSVVVTTAALMIRELALPYVLLALAFALYERRWRESAAWVATLSLFATYLLWHAQQVAKVTTAVDLASPGWSSQSGWSGFLRSMAISGGVRIIPVIAVAKLVTLLALFGWFASRERLACFASLMFAGYALMLTLFGRPNNFYWCLMITPTLLLGLIFLPQAATDVWRQLRFRPGLASAAMGERASLRSPE